MISEEQLAVLRDIDNSVAFDNAERADQLVLDGYVEKDGYLSVNRKGGEEPAGQRRSRSRCVKLR